MDRSAPIIILGLVAIVGIFTLLSFVMLPSQIVPLLIGTEITNTIAVKGLELNEPIGDDYPTLTSSHLAGLRDGSVTARYRRADYTQVLMLKKSGLRGFTGGSIRFVESEAGEVDNFLVFDNAIFELEISFSPGLESRIDEGELVDLEDEYIQILGENFAIVDSRVSGNSVDLLLFGGFGSIELSDSNFLDDNYDEGARINQYNVDALVKIKAVKTSDILRIYSIQYRLNANDVRGTDVYVAPGHCLREYLKYPMGMLTTEFDICYSGLTSDGTFVTGTGLPSNVVKIQPRGDHGYWMFFTNNRGNLAQMPLADIAGGLHYGDADHDLIFVEAPNSGSPNICMGDYFVVMNRDDDNAETDVMRYYNSDSETAYFENLAGGSRETFVDASGNGVLVAGGEYYKFVRSAGNCLAMDQTGDGQINGGEARVVTSGGGIIDLGPGFTLRLRTLGRRFDEGGADEVTQWNIFVSDGDINLKVPSPQSTGRGTMTMISESGGIKRGMNFYGAHFVEDSHRIPTSLEIYYPGGPFYAPKGGARGDVVITLERSKYLAGPTPPTPPRTIVCGDEIIEGSEECDPPGSVCAAEFFKRGTCSYDCKCVVPKSYCGDGIIDPDEECEANADCPEGSYCEYCKCLGKEAPVVEKPVPPAVEEKPPAPVEPAPPTPAIPVEKTRWQRFIDWLKSILSWL